MPVNKLGKWQLFLLTLGVLLFLVFSLSCYAENKGGKSEKKGPATYQIDGEDQDIRQLARIISNITGKNFILDDRVKGRVTIISPKPVTAEEAYRVFESILEVNGYTIVPAGEINKIVPSGEARHKNVTTLFKPEYKGEGEDRVVTQIVPLHYADANELKKLLTPLVSRQGLIASYSPANTLILTDYQSNINRLVRIIKDIDVSIHDVRFSVVKLKYASAEKLGSKLMELLQAKLQGRRKLGKYQTMAKIVPIDRINVLVVVGTPNETRKIKELIKRLDVPTPTGKGNVHVYYLEHADAEELAKVLTDISGGSTSKTKGEKPILVSSVKIVADKATNSLVITADPSDYQTLLQVIKKLDIPRHQVFVEALLMEVSTDLEISLGVEWQTFNNPSVSGKEGLLFGGSNTNNIGRMTRLIHQGVAPALGSGLSLGIVGETIKFAGMTFPSLSMLIKAMKTRNDIRILSTPQLLTTDNEEATIMVGRNVPYVTRIDEGTETTSRAIRTFDYKDVGVTLKIIPHINENRFVRMKIVQEVTRLIPGVGDEELAPTTLKRSAETTVEIKDSHTIVLGGLIGDVLTYGKSTTPCVGDAPGVGWLFSSEDSNNRKTNLLIFISPHIITNPQEATKFSSEKKKYIDKLEEKSFEEMGSKWYMK